MFRKYQYEEINPDEVFLDSGNLPQFDTQQFEGVIERPITTRVVALLSAVFVIVGIVFLSKVFMLQVNEGDRFALLASNNSLDHSTLFAERGVIYDRNGEELAWNAPKRTYTERPGFGHLLGYVSFPNETEVFEEGRHPKELVGRDGTEKIFNQNLRGENGLKIVEVDVLGEVTGESVLAYARDGSNLNLSIDADIQEQLYRYIRDLSFDRGFTGGSGVIMDVQTGELLALTNYPEYDPQVLADADDRDMIVRYQTDEGKPFLNRAVQGLYTPGSIFKLFVALGALEEEIVDPDKIFYTTGSLSLPNPYVPGTFTVFRDWKDHGAVDLEDALAYSSNVYFFEVGGGFEEQEGLGIDRIKKYSDEFGLGAPTGIGFDGEKDGVIPDPAWKQEVFDEVWRIGDTYNTSIGQYSSQVTPIQMVRAIAAIANEGKLLTPSLAQGGNPGAHTTIAIDQNNFNQVKEGMRSAVTYGTATGLNIPGVSVAAKTGTAEIDLGKQFVNSWITGFFPYEEPRYAFAVVMEKGPRENYIGGVFAVRQLLDWMVENKPEYLSHGEQSQSE